MIDLPNGGRIVTSLSELPNLRDAKEVYGDFETKSGSPKHTSINPWMHCSVAGLAITADNHQGSWYIPVGHYQPSLNCSNLDKQAVANWWLDIIDSCDSWVNANVKYDAHVSTNWFGALPECRLKCLTTLAKIIDSDRLRYGLKYLCKDWLKESIDAYEESLKPYLHRNKDYGHIPIDVMAPYACQDVLSARRLHKYIEARLPEECKEVYEMEVDLTTELFLMERTGMQVWEEIKTIQLKALYEMSTIDEKLNDIVGRPFRAHVNTDCYEVLCGQYGLPVLEWTDTGNPSFNKAAMIQYSAHPFAPKEVVELIRRFRHLHTLDNFFLRPYQELKDENNLLHTDYDQTKRTGRMGSRRPNAQQLSPDAKKLVVPPEGHSFISIDYSQIEFRMMVHYIKDADAIMAYSADPDTDFHTWVAETCGVPRKPAKTINFLMGFGGGKARLVNQLMQNYELVGELKERAEKMANEMSEDQQQIPRLTEQYFERLSKERAEQTYNTYHGHLPGLKRTSYAASDAAKKRGWVKNLAGRRRHLPVDRAHIAFNTLNQGSAADLIKERLVYIGKMCRQAGNIVKPIACVHDEILFIAPTAIARDPRTSRDLVAAMEDPEMGKRLRVPIRCSIGISEVDWKTAGSSDKTLNYDPKDAEKLAWLNF